MIFKLILEGNVGPCRHGQVVKQANGLAEVGTGREKRMYSVC